MSKSRWVTGRGEAVGAAIGAAGSARWGRGGRRRRACALSPPRGPAHARSGLRRACLLPPSKALLRMRAQGRLHPRDLGRRAHAPSARLGDAPRAVSRARALARSRSPVLRMRTWALGL